MIELTDIAYVRSGVADLGKAVTFATEIVGLELAGRTDDGTAYLRADGRHHCLALVEGRSGVIASGFTVADEDALAAAETELEHAGFTVARGDAAAARSRRVRAFVGFDDPFGNRLELVCQQETVTRPVAFTRPAGITEFGHLCLDAPIRGSTRASPTGSATPPASCASTRYTTSWPCSGATVRDCAT